MAAKRKTLSDLKKKIFSDPDSKRKRAMLNGESLVLLQKVKAHKSTGLDKIDIESAKMRPI